MNQLDQDVGMPGTTIVGADGGTGGSDHLVTCDKSGQCYVLAPNPSSLTGYSSPDCTGCEFSGSMTSPIANGVGTCYQGGEGSLIPCDSISSMVYYNGNLFIWPFNEDLDWCTWDSTAFSCSPSASSNDELSPAGFPGGMMTLSLNVGCLSLEEDPCTSPLNATGVLWSIMDVPGAPPYTEPDTDSSYFPGYIRAYGLDATNQTVSELWTSSENFLISIFALPTVSNGYLYVPTYGSTTYGASVLVYYPPSN
jgi:hypothetical protein